MKKCNICLILLLVILICITPVSTSDESGPWNLYGYDSSDTDHTILALEFDPPSISEPEDQVIGQGTTGEIIWTITDENPYTYWILRNNIQIVSSTPYESGEDVRVPIDTSTTGTWDYIIFATDESWNIDGDDVKVEVIIDDTSPPVITSPPDQIIVQGTGGSIAWVITESEPGIYWVEKDGEEFVSPCSYGDGLWIVTEIDTSTVGTWSYTIFATDLSGNEASDEVEISIHEPTVPAITSPFDQVIEVGSESSIKWIITEPDPGMYWVHKNGEEIESPQSYHDGEEITVLIDTSITGQYDYTIFATDFSGNEASNDVQIVVRDTISPIISGPSDLFIIQGDTESITWTITESDPDMCRVYKDSEELVAPRSYYDGEEITVQVDSSMAGRQTYSLFASDRSGNEVNDEVEVTVTITFSDIIAPAITSPPDVTIDQGVEGESITWTITESNPDMCLVHKNGEELVAPRSYYDGEQITVRIDTSATGIQTYSLFASDTSGNEADDQVDITVVFSDVDRPIITPPPDLTIDQWDEDRNIVWTITESNPGVYWVLENGEELESPRSYYDGEEITVLIDTSVTGIQTYSLFARDTSGNEASDQVEITVVFSDVDRPIITPPPDLTIDQWDEDRNIVWTITESNPDVYWVLENGEELESPRNYYDGEEITVLIDTSVTGIQTYSLFASDISGNEASDQVEITVVFSDVDRPVITNPPDVTIDQWDEDRNIVWTITESNPDICRVHKNGEELESPRSYYDSEEITVPIDTSITGIQTYSLFASDTSGNEASDQVEITVVFSDVDKPIITTPPDLTIDQGDEGSIVWTITESDPDVYWVLENREGFVAPQGYHDGENITVLINTSIAGTQNYSLFASDGSGNEASDQVEVIISDTVAPVIHSIPLEKIKIGTTGNITWIINETNPGEYWIMNNGSEIESPRTYQNGCCINVPLKPTELGMLSYTIFANDISGNTASNQVNITVQETAPLTITYPPYDYSTTSFTIYINGSAEGIGSIPVVTITANKKTETAELKLGDGNYVSFSHKIPLSTGTNTITVTADYGNDTTDSLTLSIIRKKEYNKKQAGGSSGGGSTSEDFHNILLKEIQREFVAKDEQVCYHFISEGNIISMINFTGMRTSGIIPARVEMLNHTSSLVNYAPLDMVYKNINIWVGNRGWASSQNIANATIDFKIEKIWVTRNNIDESSIRMNQYEDGKWNILVTSLIGQDTQYLYYKSETPGFSNFVITGKQEYIGGPGEGGIDDNKRADDINEKPINLTDPMNTTTEEDKWIPGFNIIGNLFILLIVVQLLRKKEDK